MNTSINLYKSFEIWSNREVVFTCFVFFNLISRVYNFQKWPNYRHSRTGHVRERKSWRPCNVQRKRKRTNLAAILCRLYTASCASQRLGIMKLRLVYEGTEWQNKRKCVDEACGFPHTNNCHSLIGRETEEACVPSRQAERERSRVNERSCPWCGLSVFVREHCGVHACQPRRKEHTKNGNAKK